MHNQRDARKKKTQIIMRSRMRQDNKIYHMCDYQGLAEYRRTRVQTHALENVTEFE